MRGLCELLWRYIHKKITPIGARFPARLHYLNSQINHIKGTFYLRRLEKFCVLGPICTDQFLASHWFSANLFPVKFLGHFPPHDSIEMLSLSLAKFEPLNLYLVNIVIVVITLFAEWSVIKNEDLLKWINPSFRLNFTQISYSTD